MSFGDCMNVPRHTLSQLVSWCQLSCDLYFLFLLMDINNLKAWCLVSRIMAVLILVLVIYREFL